MSMSVSFIKSSNKTNIKHNNREFTEKQKQKNSHIDYSKSSENKFLVQKDLKELYEQEFSEVLQKYNDKQKRNDRKIENYYEHIKDSKKTALQQEMIIQVGDKDDFNSQENFEIANEVLEEWFSDFEKRNPNLKVYNAVIHNDEASPHLHLNFVPVASDYKRGLEKQVSFDRAIIQQDKTLNKQRPFNDWREKEVDLVADLLQKRGIERKLVGTNEYKDVNEYKDKKDLEREIEKLENQIAEKKNDLINLTSEKPKEINKKGLGIKHETKGVKVPSGEKFMGIDIKQTKQQRTGNLIIPEKSFDLIAKNAVQNEQLKQQMKKYMATDLVKENQKLEDELGRVKRINSENVEIYYDLEKKYKKVVAENDSLRSVVRSLKNEIKTIYRELKDTFKQIFVDKTKSKEVTKDFAMKIEQNAPKSEFKRLERDDNRTVSREMSR
ncbi:plasmid recombination protein (plasmid) [Enterococcus faecalis]|uniref:plasmid recombination protein n=1 Tax=Enterococcus faecalis TaxID=1351 RepID=UPI002019976B|nr:plasmid recombination protein [Enterococcus faecalis]UQQ72117.1 plasmid recombination protein [Enterococcus faecalis]